MAAGIEFENPQVYNDGNGQYAPQFVPFYYMKKALIDVENEMLFSQLSDTFSMPKTFGPTHSNMG